MGEGSNVQDGAVLHTDPGLEVDLTVETSVRTMAQVWRGLLTFPEVMRDDRIRRRGQ